MNGSPASPKDAALDENAAAEVVRREAPVLFGAPDRAVANLRMTLPMFFMFDLSDGELRQALVVDGHLAAKKSLKTVGSYLRSIRFLERHNLSITDLAGVLELFGEVPAPLRPLSIHAREPAPDGDPAPAIAFFGDHATLTLYTEWSPSPPPADPFPGLPGGVPHAGGAVYLRAVLSIDAGYNLKWTVSRREAHPGAKWTPYRGG